MGEEAFGAWGWRIPFLVSVFLLAISVWIRLSMNESPAFKKMKEEGKTSKAPLTESFGEWRNLKIVILALVGLTAGQAVVWYTGQFYALFFLTQALKVEPATANILIALSLLIGTPFFVVFGTLSDKIGRKPIILAGCLIAALTYFPLFKALTQAANPALAKAQQEVPITVTVDRSQCSFQGSPIAREVDFHTSCDLAKRTLAQAAVNYDVVDAPPGSVASIKVGDKEIKAFDAKLTPDGNSVDAESKAKIADFKKQVAEATKAAGYPAKADPAQVNKPLVVAILTVLVIFVTMVYGPIAAMLVELFPTRIRYTSMSLPYHIGNGWFGGLLPTTAFAIVAQTGNIYNGLWYPIIVAMITFVVGLLFVRETKDVDIYAND
jgi:MFS family permease